MLARERHKRILRRQSKLAGIIWGAVAAITIMLGAQQGFENHQAQQSVASAEGRGNFWRIISGDEAPSSTRVNNTFASDLHDRLGNIDPSAKSLPKALTDFRAGVNDYGGIQGEIGFNPFDSTGQSCEVCGGLNAEMQDKLLQIKQGNVEQVIQTEVNTNQPQGYTLAPAGLPLLAWLGMVYLGGGMFALAMAVRKDCLENDYTPKELDWSSSAGFSADRFKKYSKAISPGYFLVVLPLSKKKGATYDKLLENTGLFNDEREVRQLMNQIDELPESEQPMWRDRAEKLIDNIQAQVRNNVGSDRSFHESEAESVRQAVQSVVDDVSTRLEVRQAVLESASEDPMAALLREVEEAAGTSATHSKDDPEQYERRQQPG